MRKIKILFVCHGNICRSTMAQYILQHLVEQQGISDKFYIDSAATSYEEIGREVHHATRRTLEERNIYCGDHRARRMTKQDYDDFDYIIGMDTANIRNIERIAGDDTEGKVFKMSYFFGENRDIADPWYTENFESTYDDMIRGCKGFLNYLEKRNGQML